MVDASMIDWDLAVSTASRMSGPGPQISRSEADAVVAELRGGGARATGAAKRLRRAMLAGDGSPAGVLTSPPSKNGVVPMKCIHA
jgi:hypothetical protein